MPEFDPEEQPAQKASPFDQLAAQGAPVAKRPVKLRGFDDLDAERQAIFDNVREAYASKVVEGKDYQLKFSDVGYLSQRPFGRRDEKDAIMGRKRLYWPLGGRLQLLDKATGQVVSEDKAPRALAQVPYLTGRGTFIHNGNSYAVVNQQRLRPGVYTRLAQDGSVESQFNIKPGTGRGFRVGMDPATGVFKLQVEHSQVKLYPVLRALGVADRQIEEAWGKDLAYRNRLEDDKTPGISLAKVVSKLGGAKDSMLRPDQMPSRLQELLGKMELDEETTKRTLGSPHKNVSPDVVLAATKKMLGIGRRELDPDERDDIPFQSFHSAEDFFREHVDKDAGKLLRQALWKAQHHKDVSRVPDNYFTKQLQSVLLGSGVAAASAEINPIETLDLRYKVTRMGEGGIGSTDAISKDARGVQPSHFGFIDPIRAPECFTGDQKVMTSSGWLEWALVTPETRLACLVSGRLEFHKPEAVHVSHFSGLLYGCNTPGAEYLVTPNHRIWSGCTSRNRDGSVVPYRFYRADELHARKMSRVLKTAGHLPYAPLEPQDVFVLPEIKKGSNAQKTFQPFQMVDWAEFMGWWLSEGCVVRKTGVTQISQSQEVNPKNVEMISALLSRMGVSWSYRKSSGLFSIPGKQLCEYLVQFGKSDTKYIPEELFEASIEARQALYTALMLGDGRAYRDGTRRTYCTGSARLAADVGRLAFGLGLGSSLSIYLDKRSPGYLPVHEVYISTQQQAQLIPRRPRDGTSCYYTKEFDGLVYCATVPGGLLYVRTGDRGGHWSGNSLKIGLDLRLAQGVQRGDDGNLYQTFINNKTGKPETINTNQAIDHVIAFPGEFEKGEPFVRAMVKGKIRYVKPDQVDYTLPAASSMFATTTNQVPMLAGMKGQRAIMAARMTQQALALENAEAPLVQTRAPGKPHGMLREFGEAAGAVFAKDPGTVVKVTPDSILVKGQDGKDREYELYNHLKANQKSFLHNTPVVKPGDTVQAGQVLAPSNFTDKNGEVALGANFRIGYHMADGMTHEDAVVLSESASKRLSSMQMYDFEAERGDRIHDIGTAAYTSKYPSRFSKAQLSRLDEHGVAQPGTVVRPGDPLVLAVGKRQPAVRGSLMRGGKSLFTDEAQVWEHEQPGEVVDVHKTGKGWRVTVKSYTPTRVGDKLSMSYGNKGVVSRVIPDSEMLTDKEGKPLEILLNPAGVVGRVNPSVLAELALGKVARKTGKPYVLDGFPGGSIAEMAMSELKKNGLNDTETLHDPKTGREIPEIFTGVGFMMKLHHLSESKMDVRDTGAYSMDDLPAKGGGGGGAKRLGFLETMALVSHGATNFLEDAKLIRGQRNDEFWRAYKLGMPVEMPTHSKAHDKFVETLKGAGISVHRSGNKTQVLPMTSREIEEMTADREITEPDTVEFDTGEPVKGGLFDLGATGGDGGLKWSHIKLGEPLPNPIMEEPIKLLLGLSKDQFRSVLSGQHKLHDRTGGGAIREALRRLNLDREIAATKESIKSGRRTERDKSVKRLGVLETLKRNQLDPAELVWDKLPVIPPKFRPVAKFEGTELIADANSLYKDVLEANKNYHEHKTTFGDAGETTGQLYDAVKAATGLGNPVSQESQERGVKGLLKQITGSSPKWGHFQRKVVGSSLDLVGRGVIVPDVSLDLDEIGLPVDMAWTLYKPFVIRSMVKSGMPATQALKSWETRDKQAQQAIERELESRPIVLNRAPSLHKFNMTGAKAKIVPGNALRTPIGILSGHAGDYDGDCGRFVLELRIPSNISWSTCEGLTMPVHPTTDLAFTAHARIQDTPVIPGTEVRISPTVTEHDVQPGVEIYALDPKTGEHRLYPVTKLSVHENLDMRLVTVGRRYQTSLTVSADHSLICYSDGEIKPVRPDEAKGLMVPVVRRMGGPTPQPTQQVSSFRLKLGRYADGAEGPEAIPMEFDLPLNQEVGFFLGALIGDGWVSCANAMLLSNDDADVRGRWLAAAHEFTPATGTDHVTTYTASSLGGVATERHRVSVQCRWLARWLADQVKQGALNKRIPSWCYRGSTEHLMGVLDGILSTDGCVGLNTKRTKPQLTISVTTISPDLVHDLQYLGRRLGFQTSVTIGRITVAGNQSYVVCISAPEFVQFQRRTGFKITAKPKQARIDAYGEAVSQDSSCSASTDLVPYPRHLHSQVRELVRLKCETQKEAEAAAGEVCRANSAGYWSRLMAARALRGADPVVFGAYSAILRDTDITWKQVVSVEVAPRVTGYDLTVPGPLTFATYDGVIVQDTLNVHVPVSDKAVKDVWEKMLPSKMLIQPKNFGVHILPPHGFLVGLFMGSKANEKRLPRTFATTADVKKAYKSGDLDPDDPVVVLKP